MAGKLNGRTAIVCGASAGIGLGIAEALVDDGARVVMFSNDQDRLYSEAHRIGGSPVVGDLRDPDDLERLVETARRECGSIDILVHNGGGPPDGAAASLDAPDVRDAVELLFLPVVLLTRLSLPDLTESGHGRVLAIVARTAREPREGRVLSNALRPAVVGWMKTLSTEVAASSVTVNCIAPGFIETDSFEAYYRTRSREADLASIPVGRFGQPREVGDLACFLASDLASYVTGTTITIDGGGSRCVP